jgi:signal transduction histidine kinase
MIEFFRRLFDSDFMSHGGCYFWRPELVWLHVSSDALIVLAYVMIPFSLIQLVRKRKDLEFNWMFVMFGAFILACGATHFMNVWNIWHSAYRLDGVVKAITALASIPTAILMFRLVPQAVALPSAEDLRKEIENRTRAEAEVRSLNADLERRVEERTALLQRSNAALQRFAYVSSHDLQEPIRTIRTFNQLLAKEYQGKLDPKADQYIGFVVEASARMHNLVTDLLEYSRVLDPDAPREAKNTSSLQTLQTVLLDLQEAIQDSGATITHGALPDVSMDETQLKQLFQNLLSNAIKYRRAGHPLNISVTAQPSGDRYLFAVQDNGIGIESEYFDQIFQAFKRLHGKEYPGSGVGLTICKEIVELGGGSMWVESELGQGSSFKFTLPGAESTLPPAESALPGVTPR